MALLTRNKNNLSLGGKVSGQNVSKRRNYIKAEFSYSSNRPVSALKAVKIVRRIIKWNIEIYQVLPRCAK